MLQYFIAIKFFKNTWELDMLTGDKSQCNEKKRFHRPSSSKTKLTATDEKMLFFFRISCIRTARLLCRAARATTAYYTQSLLYNILAGHMRGRGTRLIDSDRGPKITHTPQTRHSSQQDQEKIACLRSLKCFQSLYREKETSIQPVQIKAKATTS